MSYCYVNFGNFVGAESSSEGGSQPSKNSPAKKAKTTLDYKVPDDIMKLIDKDTTNQKTWQELIDKPENHKVSRPVY